MRVRLAGVATMGGRRTLSGNPMHRSPPESQTLGAFVRRRVAPAELARRVETVFAALPAAVTDELLGDPAFDLAVERFRPEGGTAVFVACPATAGSRTVVLRPRLTACDESFACYVIAHELAHAILRNGGYGSITDREEAADALAAEWGFSRPSGGIRFL